MILPENCKDMHEIRSEIDQIDFKIVELIAARSLYVKQAAKFKKSETEVKDKNRVEKVIQSKIELARKCNVSPFLIEQIYRLMIDFFISEEMKEWSTR